MNRARSFGLAMLASIALTALPGCVTRHLHLQFVDFDRWQLQGIDVFRIDETTGAPVPAGGIEFLGVLPEFDGSETLSYTVVLETGLRIEGCYAHVLRDSGVAEQVELFLYFPTSTPAGDYQVASFNAAGMSGLSPPLYLQ